VGEGGIKACRKEQWGTCRRTTGKFTRSTLRQPLQMGVVDSPEKEDDVKKTAARSCYRRGGADAGKKGVRLDSQKRQGRWGRKQQEIAAASDGRGEAEMDEALEAVAPTGPLEGRGH